MESQLRGFLSRDLANLTNRTVPAYVEGLGRDSLLILIYAGPKFESLDIVTRKNQESTDLGFMESKILRQFLSQFLVVKLNRMSVLYRFLTILAYVLFTENCERAPLAISDLQFTYVSRR